MSKGIGRVAMLTALGLAVTAGTAAAQPASVIVTPSPAPPGVVVVPPGGSQPIYLQPGQSVTISVLPGGEVRTSYQTLPPGAADDYDRQHFVNEQRPRS